MLAGLLAILTEVLLVLLIIGIVLLIVMCHGIRNAIRAVKNQIHTYKFYIVRGWILVWAAEVLFTIAIVTRAVSSEPYSIIPKIFVVLMFAMICAIYCFFHGGLIGGVIGYIYGRNFGVAYKPDHMFEDAIKKLRDLLYK